MAGRMSKSIREDFLTCQICFESYTDPKMLACMHSFCCQCLENTYKKTPRSKDTPVGVLPCPLCRKYTTVPEDGFQRLGTNFLLHGLEDMLKNEKACSDESVIYCEYCPEDQNKSIAHVKCVDCNEFMCDRCAKIHTRAKSSRDHEILTLSDLKSEKGQTILRSRRHVFCLVHPKEQVILYCRTCIKTICMKCRVLDHMLHECIELEEAAAIFESETRDVVPQLKAKSFEFERAIQETEDLRNAGDTHLQHIKAEIHKQANTLRSLIATEEARLVKEVDGVQDHNDKQIDHTKESFQISKASIDSTIELVDNLNKNGSPAEVASMKAPTTERIKELRQVKVDSLPVLKNLSFDVGKISNLKSVFGTILVLNDASQSEASLVISAPVLRELVTNLEVAMKNSIDRSNQKQIACSNNDRENVFEEGRCFMYVTSEGVTIKIFQKDITCVRASAIVNAANEMLHHGSGVARAISDKAGEAVRQECKLYIQRNGPLQVGEAIYTSAGKGNLKCHYVIHAVGPRWYQFKNKSKCIEKLKTTFSTCFQVANENIDATSIALPAISSGVFGVPKDKCANALFESVVDFCKKSTTKGQLREILIVNSDEETTAVMEGTFRTRLPELSRDL